MYLENSMVMYGIYNAETLEKLINTVHHLNNITIPYENLFAGKQNTGLLHPIYVNMQGIQHYSIDSLLYLRTVKGKYVLIYKELITQLSINANAIRVLAKGYLSISFVTPLKLKEILKAVRNTIRETNPDYDLVIKRLHLYYYMKLVTFGIDSSNNLIVQLPVFIQPYMQQPLILFQIETVPVPVIDQNTQAHSYMHLGIVPVPVIDQNTQAHPYMHLQVDRPYIALNSETYITIRQQELRTCKRIGYEFLL